MTDKKPHGWGLRLQPVLALFGRWAGMGIELVLWRNIPALIAIEFIGWEQRELLNEKIDVLTVFHIQFLWLDFEVYLMGGIYEN